MDLRDLFTTWHLQPLDGFTLSQRLEKLGCPCNQVPRALGRLRMRMTQQMEAEGHLLKYHPLYGVGQDGLGITCTQCGTRVEGQIVQITRDYIMIRFCSPVVPQCRGERT